MTADRQRVLSLEQIAPSIGSVRITVHASVPISSVIEDLIDCEPFQRLRGVKQLGPTCFIFPGAHHTRFEHSIGVYSLSLRYIEKLLGNPLLYRFHETATEIARATVTAALLHDIGHYPFSHLIEEIDELPGVALQHHEQRARQILDRPDVEKILKRWKLTPNLIADLIGKGATEGGFAIARSIIDSDLDCDKLDYLLRDSLHCGVTYGLGIDVERFLSALHIDDKNETICLNTRGRTHLLALLGARNIMYQDVYWHKTVRACGAMFKALLYRVLEKGKISTDKLHAWLLLPDESFIQRLMDHAETLNDPSLLDLGEVFTYKSRKIFKQVYSFNANDATGGASAARFFKPLLKDNRLPPTKLCLESADALGRQLARQAGHRTAFRLLIEATPVKKGHDLFDVSSSRMWNLRRNRFEALPFNLESVDNFLRQYRLIYVFAHPDDEEALKHLSALTWEKAFRAVAPGRTEISKRHGSNK
ncbi:MAG TPA: HD domain-containing protein [Chthoniobacterales bacterium]|nr:HD domain-containing protein [Chthoniobacterales bacterium]